MQTTPPPASDVAAIINKAARDVAYESGLAAAPLRRVASRAGLDPGTVARYEPSMTALIVRMFRRIAGEELNDIAARATVQPTAVAALWFVADEITADTHGNENWVWADAWSVGSRTPAVADVAREVTAAWTEFIEHLIRNGMRTGELVPVDAALIARVFLALVDGSSLRAGFSSGEPHQRADMLKTFLTEALGQSSQTMP